MKRPLNILIACEESQTICMAFRQLGHRAFSCDIQKCSGGHPEWHINDDCLKYLDGHCSFHTLDGTSHYQTSEWDLIIAHPPCTYLSKAGARWMYPKAGIISQERFKLGLEAKNFFNKCRDANCKHIAVENPRPLRVLDLPKPTQIIQPYQFGEPYSKATCLWLKGLPSLKPTEILDDYQPFLPSNITGAKRGQKWSRGIAHNAKTASKTFKGIAEAIAQQWSDYLLEILK